MAIAAALVWALAGNPASAAKKVALVIGNGAYTEAPLRNPVNDARAVARQLRAKGFDVLLRENVTKTQFGDAVADFGEKLAAGDTALFFYAGHGMQVQGRNYLLPVDARITSEQRVRLEAMDVEAILDQAAAARAAVSLVILDACRNNPFERRFRSTGGGLAQINAPEGTLIAYATAPGRVAADGDGDNGLYTQEFLKALAEPGLKVEEVFKQVRINVARASGGAQIPWEASSLTGDFFFVPPRPAAPAIDREAVFWETVKASADPAELRAYLELFPGGTFVPIARVWIAAREAARAQASAEAERARQQSEAARMAAEATRARETAEAQRQSAEAERARQQSEAARLAAEATRAREAAEAQRQTAEADRARQQAEAARMAAEASRLQAEAARAKEAEEAARLTAESERARQAAEALRATASRQVASAAGAAAPRAASSIRAMLSATAPGATLNTMPALAHVSIEDGIVRLMASQQHNSGAGNFRCLGLGVLDGTLAVPEFEIQCTTPASFRPWSVKFEGNLIEQAGRQQLQGTLTAPDGRRHTVTFR
ncbi:MAG: caspase family protein [Tagaea sp.]